MKRISICILFCVIYLSVFAQNNEVIIIGQNIKTEVVETPKPKLSYKPDVFGIDLGLGSGAQVGFRYTHNFLPFFGWDVAKLGITGSFSDDIGQVQLLTGFRGTSPKFGSKKNMDVFAAYRAGAGYDPDWGDGFDFCSEFEVGVHLTQTFFLGFFVNVFSSHFYDEDYRGNSYYEDGTSSVVGFRIGWDFGKSKTWK